MVQQLRLVHCSVRGPEGGLPRSTPPRVAAPSHSNPAPPPWQDAPKAIEALKQLDVPYLCSLPLVFQTTEEWLASELGVHPVQVALQVRRCVVRASAGAALRRCACHAHVAAMHSGSGPCRLHTPLLVWCAGLTFPSPYCWK